MTRSAISGPFWASAFLLLPIALGGCGMTTYGTGQVPEVALFREVTGGILDKNTKRDPIEYQPRAPLVLPPAAAQLPAPMDSAAAAAPDWPVDRNQLTAEADARAHDDDPRNDISQAEYRRLKPLAGVFPPGATNTSDEAGGRNEYYRSIVHGNETRKAFTRAVADSKGFSGNQRRYLTDPPVTYRAPVTDESGQVAAATEDPKKGNFVTRWWRRR